MGKSSVSCFLTHIVFIIFPHTFGNILNGTDWHETFPILAVSRRVDEELDWPLNSEVVSVTAEPGENRALRN